MSWIVLLCSGICEVFMVLLFKKVSLSQGKEWGFWFVATLLVGAISFFLLSLAMKEIDMSVAYAIWTGIGASGGVVFSSLLYREKISLQKSLFLTMIILSMVGLKLLS